VYLPCAADDAQVQQVVAPVSHAAGATSELILLVEDEVGVREFSRRCLERGGYEVLVADNSTEAERLFAKRGVDIDLLLTDVVMPGCSGPELLARLRRSRGNLRVLYMSGYTEQSTANQAAFRDSPPLLQKPFTGSDLCRRVRDALDRNLQQQES
jgi:DNA-binding NtrC family response regulator